jgi:hypothetical protein
VIPSMSSPLDHDVIIFFWSDCCFFIFPLYCDCHLMGDWCIASWKGSHIRPRYHLSLISYIYWMVLTTREQKNNLYHSWFDQCHAPIVSRAWVGRVTECVFLYSSFVWFCVWSRLAVGDHVTIRVFREGFPYFKYCRTKSKSSLS